MTDTNRRFLLRERPTGRIDDKTFQLDPQPVPEIGDGEALVRLEFISIDPTNRMWIGEAPTYLPPVAIGEVVRAVEAEHPGEEIPRPPHWGGYVLEPGAIEFWQAGEFRLHDRFVYAREDGAGAGWRIERLSP